MTTSPSRSGVAASTFRRAWDTALRALIRRGPRVADGGLQAKGPVPQAEGRMLYATCYIPHAKAQRSKGKGRRPQVTARKPKVAGSEHAGGRLMVVCRMPKVAGRRPQVPGSKPKVAGSGHVRGGHAGIATPDRQRLQSAILDQQAGQRWFCRPYAMVRIVIDGHPSGDAERARALRPVRLLQSPSMQAVRVSARGRLVAPMNSPPPDSHRPYAE